MDYGFVHNSKVYTPNRTAGVSIEENEDRNAAIEAHELAAWTTCPDGVLAYFTEQGTITTWLGTVIGRVVDSRIYRHNFGGRMIALRVRGTNGGDYYGRASYDNGSCVRLRLRKR